MRCPPASVTEETLRRTIAASWSLPVRHLGHLPWGFGAHHWRAALDGGRDLFVTLDALAPRHTRASLEAAYAGAASLAAAGLAAVCAPLPSRSGRYTVELAGGALSVTPWLAGRSPTEAEAQAGAHVERVITAVQDLHRAAPPPGLPEWAPRVSPDFARELRARTADPWHTGPQAEEARAAIAARLGRIADWTERYHRLAASARAQSGTWVPTHGEPHHANQVVTDQGLRLVDWESLALAPPERDFADLLAAGAGDRLGARPAMADLFALDWCLSEIAEYARWFAAPHTGTEDDLVALEGLHEELAGPPQLSR
ncbi:phosphotransferase [Streptomyces sp. PU-14G]|uniref:phosphotransferase n=1 Tax=Streptomyces sp. PU-14G TaxID=2800808 RepID=UPI0034DEF7B8